MFRFVSLEKEDNEETCNILTGKEKLTRIVSLYQTRIYTIREETGSNSITAGLDEN